MTFPPPSLTPRGGRLWLIHPSGRPPTPIGVGRLPSALAVHSERVWVTDAGSNDVRVIDPRTARTLARVPVGAAPSAIAIGGGMAWVADRGSNDVTNIDLATLRRAGSPIPTRGRAPVAIAYGAGATVWVANRGSSDVTAIHPSRTDASRYVPAPPIYVSGGPISVAGGVRADAWVGTADGGVVHLGSSRNRLARGSRCIPPQPRSRSSEMSCGSSPGTMQRWSGSGRPAHLASSRASRFPPRSCRRHSHASGASASSAPARPGNSSRPASDQSVLKLRTPAVLARSPGPTRTSTLPRSTRTVYVAPARSPVTTDSTRPAGSR